jgi:hypothetical protein
MHAATGNVEKVKKRTGQTSAESRHHVWIAHGERGDLALPALEFPRLCIGILFVLALEPDRRVADNLIREDKRTRVMSPSGERGGEALFGPGRRDILKQKGARSSPVRNLQAQV